MFKILATLSGVSLAVGFSTQVFAADPSIPATTTAAQTTVQVPASIDPRPVPAVLNCAVDLSTTVLPKVDLPAVPGNLTDQQARTQYTVEMMKALNQNSENISKAFEGVSDKNRDTAAEHREMTISKDPDAQKMMQLFGEFNDQAASIAPPAKFSAESANSGLHAVGRYVLRTVGMKLPPTLTQWLKVYTSEAPKFESMRESLDKASKQVESRTESNIVEVTRMESLIAQAKAQLEVYRKQKDDLDAQVKSATLDDASKQDLTSTILIPLSRKIDELENFIQVHALLVAKKKTAVMAMWEALGHVTSAVRLAVPVLRNAADLLDDSLYTQSMDKSAAQLRAITAGALSATNEALKNTLEMNDSLATSPQVANLVTEVGNYMTTIADHNKRLLDYLPTLEARDKEYTETIVRLGGATPKLQQLDYQPVSSNP